VCYLFIFSDYILNVICHNNSSFEVSTFNNGINVMCGNLRRKHGLSSSTPSREVTNKGTYRDRSQAEKRKGDSVTLTSPAVTFLGMVRDKY
jgi:hypothetical protein